MGWRRPYLAVVRSRRTERAAAVCTTKATWQGLPPFAVRAAEPAGRRHGSGSQLEAGACRPDSPRR